VVVTAAIVSVVARYALELSWLEGFLLGAVVASTDAAAVFFLLRSGGLKLRQHVASTLELESATNDPAAVLLTIVATSALLAGTAVSAWGVALSVILQISVGLAFGIGGGHAISWALNRLPFPAGLHPLMAVASAVMLYALTAVAGGSGFLAVFLGGLVVGNRPTRAFANITSFHDAATWLCQMVMFIVLGLLVTRLCRPLTRAHGDGAACPRGSSALRAFVTAGLQSDARYAGFTAVRPRSGRQIVAQGNERRRRDAALG
jgi:cell volume regulation protein A